MSLKKNSRLVGQHALLSPSTYQWLDKNEDELRTWFFNKAAAARGDALHAYAQQAITLRIEQADNGATLNTYINDAIRYGMTAEMPLYFSDECFGTCDAISIREERWDDGVFMTLRIHDLKTGLIPASIKQLLIYAAIFFTEYAHAFKPETTRVILCIYQNDAIDTLIPDAAEIRAVISRVKHQASRVGFYRGEDL